MVSEHFLFLKHENAFGLSVKSIIVDEVNLLFSSWQEAAVRRRHLRS